MNYIRQLSAAFDKLDADTRITPYHISLYISLFRRWNLNFFRNPVSVSRYELMRQSKIGSVNTYIKCLKELDAFGFIQYKPSYNRHRGSLIYMYTFDNASDNAGEQAVLPFKNNRNNERMDKQAKIDFASCEKKKKISYKGFGPDIPPIEEHVRIYFDEKGFPPLEAEKFFNYFQSNGWLVGGRSKMKDWKAAARNWILNAQKFSRNGKYQGKHPPHPKPGQLNTPGKKNYSEPL